MPVSGERRLLGDDRRAWRRADRKTRGTERHTAERNQRSDKTTDNHGVEVNPLLSRRLREYPLKLLAARPQESE